MQKLLLLCLLLTLVPLAFINATSIIPYSNLGELASESPYIATIQVLSEESIEIRNETIFTYQVRIIESVKGSFDPFHSIQIVQQRKISNGLEKIVFGDIDLKIGHTYLLFMEHLSHEFFRPKVMNYYVFEEFLHKGKKLFKPSEESSHIHFSDHHVEPLTVFNASELIDHLKSITMNNFRWNSKEVMSSLSTNQFEVRNDAPDHCSNYYFRNPTRWKIFDEGRSLPVYMDPDIDALQPNTEEILKSALNGLEKIPNSSVDFEFSGYQDFDPCTSDKWYDQSSTGYNLTLWAQKHIGTESIFVQFEDPCGELKEFRCGQKGVIAIGGLFRTLQEQHEYEGQQYYNGYMGYVVIAKGAGCISSQGYQKVLMHEITHALSLGHIKGSGSALMNKNCCNDISDLDEICFEHLYGSEEIDAEINGSEENAPNIQSNLISLSTNIFKPKSKCIIFKKDKRGQYEYFTTLSMSKKSYHQLSFKDPNPGTQSNYYIEWIDSRGNLIDKTTVYINRTKSQEIKITPNPSTLSNIIHVKLPKTFQERTKLTIYTLAGKQIFSKYVPPERQSMDLRLSSSNIPSGTFVIRINNSQMVHSQKLIIK